MSLNFLPRNFHWRQYIILNKDLQYFKTKKEAINHYIKYGKKEKRQYLIKKSNYKNFLPEDFNWQHYLLLNKDLTIEKTKKNAILHYIIYGKNINYKL
jgi:hypothetical protein